MLKTIVAEQSDPWEFATAVVVAFIALCSTFVAALFAYKGHREAQQANYAVNHKKKGEPRLVDQINEMYEVILNIFTKTDELDKKFSRQNMLVTKEIIDLRKKQTHIAAQMSRVDKNQMLLVQKVESLEKRSNEPS